MKSYDFENDGTIDSKELVKVIRKLGFMNPEPHFNILMKAGKIRPTDKRISYMEFSSNLLAEINKRKRHSLSIHEELL
jgi:Ca2+-binding EF-hand superfamily protein